MASYESETFEARAKSSASSWPVSSAKNPDPVDPQHFDFLDPDQIEKKNILLSYPNLNCWKKEIIKNFLISEWFIKIKAWAWGEKENDLKIFLSS